MPVRHATPRPSGDCNDSAVMPTVPNHAKRSVALSAKEASAYMGTAGLDARLSILSLAGWPAAVPGGGWPRVTPPRKCRWPGSWPPSAARKHANNSISTFYNTHMSIE